MTTRFHPGDPVAALPVNNALDELQARVVVRGYLQGFTLNLVCDDGSTVAIDMSGLAGSGAAGGAGAPGGTGGGVSTTTKHVLLRDGISRVLLRDGSFLTFR